ncbi:MAG TPA: cytochrome c oxidase subunit I [Acidimicrobiia bacterium]|nr:cytochrome c oxidase subunit I [Acidimicrobiia bacterium]
MTTVSPTLTPPKTRRDWLRRPTATRGFWSWFTTIDHKKIGLMYGGLAIVFLVFGGVEALLIRLQLAAPNGTVLTAAQYNAMFTMHGTTMVFLMGMPLAVAFGNYLIPLQIGARDVAFPRLNAFGFWVVLFGGSFIYSSFFLGGAPNGGWFGYTPLTSSPVDIGTLPGRGPDFWAVGLIMLGIGSTTSALNIIVTTLNMRARGMTLMRMPVFCWMMLVVGFLTIFAMPIVTVALVMVWFDRNLASNFFNAAAGGDPLLYQHLFWLFGHPEVYILILPGMGIVSEILPVMSRKPLFGYSVVVFSGIAIGFLGFGVWAHHMFATGLGPVAISAFSLSTMLIAIPTGVKIFNWLGTVWGGSLRLTTAMLFQLGFIAMFTIGGLSGVLHAVVPADTQQTDTYFVVAHIHYVLFGGLVFAIFGGFFYWFPLVFGRFMNERLGKVTFWLVLVGFNLTFFPMHILGLQGQPRRTYRYAEGMGFDTMNMIATVGAFVITASVLLLVINMVVSRLRGEIAPHDPWDARTLEWSVSSYPPPEYNFEEIPNVEARDEYWHRKYTEDEDGRPIRLPGGGADEPARAGADEGGAVATLERDGGDGGDVVPTGDHGGGDEGHGIHMPSPSYFPLVMTSGMPVLAYGVVFHSWLLGAVGVAVLLFGMYAWALEPSSE